MIIHDKNGKVVDLSGAFYRDVDFQGVNLEGLDLSGADFTGVDLSGAKLKNANLQGAIMKDANLRGADLRFANLEDSKLQNADLTSANLRNANLQGANLTGAVGIKAYYGAGVYGVLIVAVQHEKAVMFAAPGCFWGNLEEMKKEVKKEYAGRKLFAYLSIIVALVLQLEADADKA